MAKKKSPSKTNSKLEISPRMQQVLFGLRYFGTKRQADKVYDYNLSSMIEAEIERHECDILEQQHIMKETKKLRKEWSSEDMQKEWRALVKTHGEKKIVKHLMQI